MRRSSPAFCPATLFAALLAMPSPVVHAAGTTVTTPPSPLELVADTERGHFDIPMDGLPGLPSARFLASASVEPKRATRVRAPDPTPADPYDDPAGQNHMRLFYTPQRFAPTRFRIGGRAESGGAEIAVFVGSDDDGDGRPDAGEERCRAAGTGEAHCDFTVEVDDTRSHPYWVMAQMLSGPVAAVTAESSVVDATPCGSCVRDVWATGPGHLASGEEFVVRVGYDMPDLVDGEIRVALLTVESAPASTVLELPMRLIRTGNTFEPVALRSLDARMPRFTLPPGTTNDRIFVDVPPGTAELDFHLEDTFRPTRVLVGRSPDPVQGPGIEPAPPSTAWTGPIVNPAPGRWFITLENDRPYETTAGRLQLDLVVPVGDKIARGSYYNPARPGHGVFIYPSGTAFALLWYTYREDGTPTWYYAQGPRTGSAPFVWPLYRAAWDGVTRHLAPVGRVALSNRTTSGGITFTYELDGETGSEALRPWLEGCGSLDGAPVDANGHWFDPAMPGYGFSAQTHPDYEFIAGFLFDANGEPRFLAAERGGAFDAAASPVPLYQLKGFAPTAPWTSPVRTDVGVLGRIYSEAGIDQIAVEATYVDGVPGTWSSSAPVRQLGEPVGCP